MLSYSKAKIDMVPIFSYPNLLIEENEREMYMQKTCDVCDVKFTTLVHNFYLFSGILA